MLGFGRKKDERPHPFDGFEGQQPMPPVSTVSEEAIRKHELSEAMARADAQPEPFRLPAEQMLAGVSQQRAQIVSQRDNLANQIAEMTKTLESLNLVIEAHDVSIKALDDGLGLSKEAAQELEKDLTDAIKLDPVETAGPAKRSRKVS